MVFVWHFFYVRGILLETNSVTEDSDGIESGPEWRAWEMRRDIIMAGIAMVLILWNWIGYCQWLIFWKRSAGP